MGIFKRRSLELIADAPPEEPVDPRLVRALGGSEGYPGFAASLHPQLQEQLIRSDEARAAGSYKGKHYTAYVEQVEKLMREKQLDGAEALLLALVDAAECEANISKHLLPPWYFNKLAILYRKKKDYDAEIAICERYLKHERPVSHRVSEFAERADKAKGFRDKLRSKGQ